MDWVKLAQRYYHDPAIRQLDDAAELMFVRGLARAGEVARHGFIPENDVELLTRRRRYETVVDALLRSGLWTRVAGGYQVTRWSDWQDHLDALTRKRTTDRDRQRRRRAAARENGNHLSRDMSRDVTAVEGEEEVLKVQLGGLGTTPQANGKSPPRRCPKHINDPDPPRCGACKEFRLAAEAWEREHTTAERQRQHAAAAQRRTTPRCGRCGNRHTGPCDGDTR